MSRSFSERYDKAYFDRWYRAPKTRIKSKAAIARKVIMALSIAEYYLERPVRTVLDVGCGEGNWFPALKSLRPGIRYSGVDSSSYAVSRFGKRRNIRSGTFGTLENLNLSDHYDLVICSDTLFYLTLSELQDGLKAVAKRTRGVAFLELYTRKDSLIGDFPQEDLQNVSFYRKLLKNLGFLSVGSHCYLGPAVSDRAMEMEKGECS